MSEYKEELVNAVIEMIKQDLPRTSVALVRRNRNDELLFSSSAPISITSKWTL
jgi:hypothetical protein